MKVRECFNDLHILNLNNFEWKWIRPYGDMIESRRNYGYFQINKFFFVYGGINNYGRYFNDLYCLSLGNI